MFDKEKLLLAFEYGMHLAIVAQAQKVELTKELVERTEKIVLNEFEFKDSMKLAQEMAQNLLAAFQPEEKGEVDVTNVNE